MDKLSDLEHQWVILKFRVENFLVLITITMVLCLEALHIELIELMIF